MMANEINTESNNTCLHSKIIELESLLSEDEVDLWALREHCLTPGGLMNGEMIPVRMCIIPLQ